MNWQPTWADQAKCRGRDTEDFFPDERKTIAEELETSYAARRVCWGCPVRAQCLEESFGDRLRPPDEFGIFGGTTPGQRRLVVDNPDRVAVLLWELDLEMQITERISA